MKTPCHIHASDGGRHFDAPGQAEWRDYRACWWDADTASMAFGPVLRVLVQG